ncbi:NADPH-dependent F420 reductase [Methanococcus aeolicus]|uniref:NADPH-dependent F420 reductase n=1 Tax=Methanococcus aeolicus (strain ATCC BAA-1280 / DSM 17508 / OCM 812 / Nankai-3) TaxID=419665 RepID=A6UWG2_META3|nr:NADPH-dependent F420 reductase [Methanococcus aeolicus]ABR56834.1 NADPH-dependent F420 reductase [Methanococcus aeolicus Nankai-3]UXM84836.1 NADPH-dependent F420 reductase [Methanococcus aeolicus]
MKIAILGGTGDQGFGLALRFAKNHDIIIGSRKKEKADSAVVELKKILDDHNIKYNNIVGMDNKEASKEGDLIILSLPYEYTMSTIKEIKEELAGKIVVSIGVPLATAIGDKPTRIVLPPQGSVAEMVQDYLKNSKVVSAFHNVCSKELGCIGDCVECDILVCGNDVNSNKIVVDLAQEIDGVRGIDCGKLELSRYIEQITPLLIGLNIKYKLKGSGIRITGL